LWGQKHQTTTTEATTTTTTTTATSNLCVSCLPTIIFV
jgi:hypothetical protein